MKCIICDAQAWCVTSEGDVQEHMMCYDCSAYSEMLEDAQTEAAIAAYEADLDDWGPEDEGCCPCGGPSCDGTCDTNTTIPDQMTSEEAYSLGCHGCTSGECNECSEHNMYDGDFEVDCPF